MQINGQTDRKQALTTDCEKVKQILRQTERFIGNHDNTRERWERKQHRLNTSTRERKKKEKSCFNLTHMTKQNKKRKPQIFDMKTFFYSLKKQKQDLFHVMQLIATK